MPVKLYSRDIVLAALFRVLPGGIGRRERAWPYRVWSSRVSLFCGTQEAQATTEDTLKRELRLRRLP